MDLESLGTHVTTQCYFSKWDQTPDKPKVSRTDLVFTYFILRCYSDDRKTELKIRLNPGGR